MPTTVKQQLISLAEENYRNFASKLVPGTDNILGVRRPLLRKLAKTIAKATGRDYLQLAPQEYFEELMLQALLINELECSLLERLAYITDFVPKINNWSVCDTFCNSLKFTKTNKKVVWDLMQAYFAREQEFEVRFAVVMCLEYYLEEEYLEAVLFRLDQIQHPGYYVKMAVAWALATCFAKFPIRTKLYLANNSLDDFTYNKTLQKIIESYRVPTSVKAEIRTMKRK